MNGIKLFVFTPFWVPIRAVSFQEQNITSGTIQYMKHLGEVIRKWRLMSEITVRDAAKMIGINASVLCRLEAGDNVDGITLRRVLQWLLA